MVPDSDPSFYNKELDQIVPLPDEVILYLKAVFIKPISIKEKGGIKPLVDDNTGYLIIGKIQEVREMLINNFNETLDKYSQIIKKKDL